MKRAHVLQREQCGEVVVLDIGLGEFGDPDNDAWTLADAEWLAADVPGITWDAHKGTRGKLAIVGGAEGMAGAVVLSSEAALRSGAGLVYAHVNAVSVLPLQISVPQAIAHAVTSDGIAEQLQAVQAVVIGPGFGRSAQSEALLHTLFETLINEVPGTPVLLDADALTLIGVNAERLTSLARNREVVCTPHVLEFARLLGKPVGESLNDRVAQVHEYVARTGAQGHANSCCCARRCNDGGGAARNIGARNGWRRRHVKRNSGRVIGTRCKRRECSGRWRVGAWACCGTRHGSRRRCAWCHASRSHGRDAGCMA